MPFTGYNRVIALTIIYLGIFAVIRTIAINFFNTLKADLEFKQSDLTKALISIDALEDDNTFLENERSRYKDLYSLEKTRAENYSSILTSEQKNSVNFKAFETQYSADLKNLEQEAEKL